MEAKEIVKLPHPDTGRIVTLHLTENEFRAILSVGLNTLVSQGFINLAEINTTGESIQ